MLHREVYERTPQFEDRVAGARLRTYEWQFLANLDGKSTVGDILRRLKIDEPTIADFIFEQERNGAISPRLLSFEEFLNSPDADAAEEPALASPKRPAASAASKRTSGEELRAIARLSIAAAIGEILSLLSKRRAAAGGAAVAPASKAQPAAPATPAVSPAFESAAHVVEPGAPVSVEPATLHDFTQPLAAEHGAATEHAAFTETPFEQAAHEAPAPNAMPDYRYDRDDLANFQVFDWTLPVAPRLEPQSPETTEPVVEAAPANGTASYAAQPQDEAGFEEADLDYLRALSAEPAPFEDGLTIADRLLRDYGPLDATEVRAEPLESEASAETIPWHETVGEAAHESLPSSDDWSGERDPNRVTFSVNDLAGYIERIDPPAAAVPEAPPPETPPAYPQAFEVAPAVAFDVQPPAHQSAEPAAATEAAHVAPPEPPPAESPDVSMDPIVFSLSARNPDSFWSGKK